MEHRAELLHWAVAEVITGPAMAIGAVHRRLDGNGVRAGRQTQAGLNVTAGREIAAGHGARLGYALAPGAPQGAAERASNSYSLRVSGLSHTSRFASMIRLG